MKKLQNLERLKNLTVPTCGRDMSTKATIITHKLRAMSKSTPIRTFSATLHFLSLECLW